jgi:hypothetical protein
MNRRRFLTMLGLAPVVAKAAPLLKLTEPGIATLGAYDNHFHESFIDMPSEEMARDNLIGQWVSYKFTYTMLPPPPPISRLKKELPYTETIDGVIVTHQEYVRDGQVELA